MQDILKAYNSWWAVSKIRDDLKGVQRSQYLNSLIPSLAQREIIELYGVRRAGKTTIMYQLIDYLISTGVNPKAIFYIQFDDDALQLSLKDEINPLEKVLNNYFELYGDAGKRYIFLDELQTLPKFGGFLKRYYETNPDYKFIISGSSINLLEDESVRKLVGRTVKAHVLPFSFKEILDTYNINYKESIKQNKLLIQTELNEYMEFGGFPRAALMIKDKKSKKYILEGGKEAGYTYPFSKEIIFQDVIKILREYFTDILYKDIVKVYSIREVNTLERLATYLLLNAGKKTNFRSLAELLNTNKDTVADYLEYLKRSLLFIEVPFYSKYGKGTVRKDRKYYTVDLGLRSAIGGKGEDGFIAENTVLLKLKEKYSKVFYWQGKNECDFIAEEFNTKLAVEVKYQTQDREVKGLIEAMEKFDLEEGLVITKDIDDKKDFDGKRIKYMPLWKFLLDLY